MRTTQVSEAIHTFRLRGLRCAVCAAAALLALAGGPSSAGSPERWEARVGGGVLGTVIGIASWAKDGCDGPPGDPLPLRPDMCGVFTLLYREEGPEWGCPTGFYGEEFERTPIPPGGSKTWWDFYLWAQNWTLDPPGQVQVRTTYEDASVRPPDGYTGHLVLDYVPASCNWTGPTGFWLDLTQRNTITLPCATVTNPLQGTRFHLTVYTTVPEPSSLVALAGLSLLAAGGALGKRRR